MNKDNKTKNLKKQTRKKRRCNYDLLTIIKFFTYLFIIVPYNYYCYKYFTHKNKRDDTTSTLRKKQSKTTGDCTTSDVDCYTKVWKGEAVKKYPQDEVLDVSVVISYCGEIMSLFTDYIDNVKSKDRILVSSIDIICRCHLRCPDVKDIPKNAKIISNSENYAYPDVNFMSWLAKQLDPSSSSSILTKRENHLLLFLHSNSIEQKAKPRKLLNVLHSAIENGFGCITPPHSDNSLYHKSEILTTFEPHSSKSSPFPKFKHWLRHLSILSTVTVATNELVPVCYGSSFAIKSSDILSQSKSYHPIIKSIEADLMINGMKHKAVQEYVERLWASIFSYPLQNERISLVKKYSTGIFEKECCTYTVSQTFNHL